MRIEWKDVTSYYRSDEARVSKSFEYQTDFLRFTVTRHENHGPDVWTLRCDDVGIDYNRALDSKELDDAKAEAIEFVRRRLSEMLRSLPKVK